MHGLLKRVNVLNTRLSSTRIAADPKKDLQKRLDKVLGSYVSDRRRQSENVKAVTQVLEAWERKWDLVLNDRPEDIAGNLLYNAWKVTSVVDQREVDRSLSHFDITAL